MPDPLTPAPAAAVTDRTSPGLAAAGAVEMEVLVPAPLVNVRARPAVISGCSGPVVGVMTSAGCSVGTVGTVVTADPAIKERSSVSPRPGTTVITKAARTTTTYGRHRPTPT